MTGSVTMAAPIQFIDGESCTKKWKGRKTALSGYYTCLSRDLLLMALGQTHTHTPTFVDENNFKKPGACGPQYARLLIDKPTCRKFKLYALNREWF